VSEDAVIRPRIRCKGVLFDWDGTLVDSLPMKIRNAGLLFSERLGVDRAAVEESYRRHSGIPRRHLFDSISEDVQGEPLPESVYGDLDKAFTERNKVGIRPEHTCAGAERLLVELRAAGASLLVVSSSAVPDDVQSAAEITGLAGHVDEVLGSLGAFSKGLGHVSYMCRKYALEPQDLCVVGDDKADVLLGREAGVHVIAKVGTRTVGELRELEPDGIINDLMELLQLVEFNGTNNC
jgi:phosphoglycolate phosphatase